MTDTANTGSGKPGLVGSKQDHDVQAHNHPAADCRHHTPMIEKISIDGVSGHMARNTYEQMQAVMQDVTGWDIDMMSHLEGPEGTGLHLQMNDDLSGIIREGRFPFTLEKHLDGYFGESTGSANVTTVKQKEQIDLSGVISILHSTGQIDDALEIVEGYRDDDDPDAKVILTYALSQYAKGWLAEEIISAVDWWSKGSVSQDEGGIDGYAHGEMAQLGSITRYNSHKKELEESDRRELLYQWDAEGNIWVADVEDCLEMNDRVSSQDGVSKTLIRRRSKGLKICDELGRGIRYLWW